MTRILRGTFATIMALFATTIGISVLATAVAPPDTDGGGGGGGGSAPQPPQADVRRIDVHHDGDVVWAEFKEDPIYIAPYEKREDQMQLAQELKDAQAAEYDLAYLSFKSGEYAIIVNTEAGLKKDGELSYPDDHRKAVKAYHDDGVYLWHMS